MNTQTIKSIHPLLWIAGIAVTLFSVAGIAAVMGWIPASLGHPNESAVLEKQAANSGNSAKAPHAPVAKAHTEPTHVAVNVPSIARCAECGVVESVQETPVPGAIGLPRRMYRPTALGERMLRAWTTFTREIAWEVVPELSELLIKQRMDQK